MKDKTLRKREAFTLIELLVVITIIGALVSLILPAIRAARSRANEATCVNNLKQIYMAAMMYADDNDGNLPPTKYVNPGPGEVMRELLANYIPDEDAHYTCPSNPIKDVYLSSPTWGYSCYSPSFQDYSKWEADGDRNWDSNSKYVINGNALIWDWVEDEIGGGVVAPSHRNKFGLIVTTKGAFYFWYVVTAGQAGVWAEYPSGEDAPLK